MMRRAAPVAALLLLLAAGAASAHNVSTAYLRLEAFAGRATAALDLALRDLEPVIGIDADGDGAITWGELKARRGEIEDYVGRRLRVEAGATACELAPEEMLADRRSDGAYAAFRFTVLCPDGAAPTALDYDLFFELDPTHRGLVSWSSAAGAGVAALSPDASRLAFAGADAGGATMAGFFWTGVHHIAFGFDHVLFLLVVILPFAVTAAPERRASIRELLRIVTAFTAAHGLSVTLAVLGVVTLPSRLVEAGIAATIVLTAADNIRPFLPGRRWAAAFGFGLIHGLGFARALGPLNLGGADLALALFGFNIGIEAGQLVLATLILGFAWPTVSLTGRARALLRVGSSLALAAGFVWFAQRAFGIGI